LEGKKPMMKFIEIEDYNNGRMRLLVVVEGVYEGDDKKNLFKHKHHIIQKTLSHISKTMVINNLKTLTPWSF
jgi:hypothetical protein